MALQLASNIVPSSGGTFYLLEDLYLKGGFQIRDDLAERDKIAIANLKVGALVLTVADNKIWKVKEVTVPSKANPDAVESVVWEEFLTNASGGGGSTGGFEDAPTDDKTYGRKNGQWVEVTSSEGPVPLTPKTRVVAIHTVEDLAVGQSVDFEFPLAISCIVLKLTVTRPVKVTAFSTGLRDETNPYQFLATEDHLTDDGTMLLADGSTFRSRNFSILANMEDPASNMIYWSMESVDEVEGSVTLTVTYLPLEVAAEENTGEEDTGEVIIP